MVDMELGALNLVVFSLLIARYLDGLDGIES